LIGGELVAEARAEGWIYVGDEGAEVDPARSFDLHLPERFADGHPHRVDIKGGDGKLVAGSPVTVLAFADGLSRFLPALPDAQQEAARAALVDDLVPMSWPLARYAEWSQRFVPPRSPAAETTAAVLLVGDGDVAPSLSSLEDCSTDWIAASVGIPGQGELGFDHDLVSQFLAAEGAASSLVVICPAGTRFRPGALDRLLAALSDHPSLRAAYGDLDLEGEDGRAWPLFFPAFDEERMLEQGYCSYVFAAPAVEVQRAARQGARDIFRLFQLLIQDLAQPAEAVLHVPGALAVLPRLDHAAASASLTAAARSYLGARGIRARVRGVAGALFPAVRILRERVREDRVSVVIPTRNRAGLLRTCIQSVQAADTRSLREILVVDNDSSDAETLAYLRSVESTGVRVLRAPGPFNYARLNNLAVNAARGEAVCLLNNDTEVLDRHWLEELLSRLADPGVGAVGPMLLWPNDVVQHGGVVLGPQFAATHAFNDRVAEDPGYTDLLRVAHQCSAVTAACLLTRRSHYLEVGGLDEAFFAVNFNDVDYCLKLRARGLRVVFTPHTRLRHLESASRGSDLARDRQDRYRRELEALRARWRDVLVDDPYYHPALSLDSIPFSALAWPPRSLAPRLATPPRPADLPAGLL